MKTLFTLILLTSFFSFKAEASKDRLFLGMEVVCSESLKNLDIDDLCGKKKNCSWSVLKESESAKAWKKGEDIRVTEVRRKEALKFYFFNPNKFFEIRVPWCPSVGKITLPQSIRKVSSELMKEKEIVYILSEKDRIHLPRLKSIKHPCRKLKKVKLSKVYSYYYLMPQPLKGCK